MKDQNNSIPHPSGSLLIQPGQYVTQPSGNMSTMQAGPVGGIPHQNLQVWAPGPGGAISVSGLHGNARGHPSMVTLPQGQTVLMTNLVSTTNNPHLSMSVSSPMSKLAPHNPQMTNPLLLPNPTSSPLTIPMTTHLGASSMMTGLGGPISVTLPSGGGGMIPNSSMTGPTAYVSSAPVQMMQNVSNSMPHYTTQSTLANSGYPTMLASGPMMMDHTGMNVRPQQKLMGLSTQYPQLIAPNINQTCQQQQLPLQQSIPLQQSSYLHDLQTGCSVACSGVTTLTTSGPQNSMYSTPNHATHISSGPSISTVTSVTAQQQQPVVRTTAEQSINIAPSSVATPVTSCIMSNNITMASNTQSNTVRTSLPTDTEATSVNRVISTSSQEPMTRKEEPPNTTSNTAPAYVPTSLTKLMLDLDPHLQLDPDAQEVLVNLANEFLTSVASKAQKLAKHRGSSLVDAKDVVFCLDRDWDIAIPGHTAEDRLIKHVPVVEAHRQRLALIKKQIKKM